MTKLNKKKLNKSTIAIIFLALALVLAISFGATLALFTASSRQMSTSSVTAGYIHLSGTGSFVTSGTAVMPGQTLVNETIGVSPEGSTGSAATDGQYVAMKITAQITDAANQAVTGNNLSGCITVTAAQNWKQYSASSNSTYELLYVYSTNSLAVTVGDTVCTAITDDTAAISSIVFSATDHAQEVVGNDDTTYTLTNNMMGASIVVTVQFHSVQATENANYTFEELLVDASWVSSGT